MCHLLKSIMPGSHWVQCPNDTIQWHSDMYYVDLSWRHSFNIQSGSENVSERLYMITIGSNNLNQWIRPAQHSGGILSHSFRAKLFNLCHVLWRSYAILLKSFHSISTGLRMRYGLWLGHSKRWSHSAVDFSFCFRSLSCCIILFQSFSRCTDTFTLS